MQRVIFAVSIFFLYAAAWFCLWGIGTALVANPLEAVMLFPFGLRVGVLLQTPRRCWSGILCAEAVMLWVLYQQFGASAELWALLCTLPASLALLRLTAGWLQRSLQSEAEWQWPLQQGAVVVLAAALQAVIWSLVTGAAPAQPLLLGLSGGLTVAPTCLLIWQYLSRQRWAPLEPGLIHQPLNMRLHHLGGYLVLFAFSVWLQRQADDVELRRFAPFCLAIPIVFMSYRYGWQGALLATLLNGVVLIASEPHGMGPHRDLLLSLLAQSLTGMLLGAGIERQRHLNHQLARRLEENRRLARSLVTAEEDTRRKIARELHDEVGQTITVIRTHSGIIRKLTQEPRLLSSASAIESYALRVYDGIHDLLAQLWPAALSTLSLSGALAALLRDLVPPDQGITTSLNWQIPDAHLDDTLKIILYRLCQEGVTNACRHAEATHIDVSGQLNAAGQYCVSIQDNGRGVDVESVKSGYGLRGIQDRVRAIGGECALRNEGGTRLVVILPAIFGKNTQN